MSETVYRRKIVGHTTLHYEFELIEPNPLDEIERLKERIERLININHTQALYRENEEIKWGWEHAENEHLRALLANIGQTLNNEYVFPQDSNAGYIVKNLRGDIDAAVQGQACTEHRWVHEVDIEDLRDAIRGETGEHIWVEDAFCANPGCTAKASEVTS